MKNVKNSFCSHSCSGKYNNVKKIKYCINCKKETVNNKYCSALCQMECEWKIKAKDIESGKNISGSENSVRRNVKRYLLEKNGHQCERCKLTEWMGEPIPLTCDHIDGNSENNVLSNFRLICANCDRQQPTYGSRNLGKGRKSRRKNK